MVRIVITMSWMHCGTFSAKSYWLDARRAPSEDLCISDYQEFRPEFTNIRLQSARGFVAHGIGYINQLLET
jgi:hypothetical protein